MCDIWICELSEQSEWKAVENIGIKAVSGIRSQRKGRNWNCLYQKR